MDVLETVIGPPQLLPPWQAVRGLDVKRLTVRSAVRSVVESAGPARRPMRYIGKFGDQFGRFLLPGDVRRMDPLARRQAGERADCVPVDRAAYPHAVRMV